MRVMKKVILSLFIALSLLVAPIAHAAGMNCEGDNCQMTEQSKKQSKGEKQDDGKMANAGHHCCCQSRLSVAHEGSDLHHADSERTEAAREDTVMEQPAPASNS